MESQIEVADLQPSNAMMPNPHDQVVLRKGTNGIVSNGNDSCSNVSMESNGKQDEEVLRRRSASMLEAKEHAHGRLRDELLKAHDELKLKDEECKKLATIREKMEEELEELTASLFEEANKMVQDANIKRMQAEKLLKEARAKVDVLQAEVTALKSLVITSTPSMPNLHLHPQHTHPTPVSQSSAVSGSSGLSSIKTAFVKGHRRSTSHHNFSNELLLPNNATITTPEVKEVDPQILDLFSNWRQKPSLDETCPFLALIVCQDIVPCFAFANSELSQLVLEAVINNTLTIEPLPDKLVCPRRCGLTESEGMCRYQLKLGDISEVYTISLIARNRVAAVCNFYTYIRYINQGLVKTDVHSSYWEIIHLRKQMCLAKLGLS